MGGWGGVVGDENVKNVVVNVVVVFHSTCKMNEYQQKEKTLLIPRGNWVMLQ